MISGDWTANAALRGQLASKNLDSTERFVLGGPSGVRGYPVGEAAGDEGWLLTLGLGWRASSTVSASAFIDHGGVKLNDRLWANWNAGNPALQNSYRLSSAGVGVDWRFAAGGLLNFAIARPLGSNPGRDVNNRNVDGGTNGTRAWVSAVFQF